MRGGRGLSSERSLLGEPVAVSSTIVDWDLSYGCTVGRYLLTRTAVSVVYVRTKGQIAGQDISSRTTRVGLVPQLGARLGRSARVYVGTGVSNGKDFADLDIRTTRNLRFDFRTDVAYDLSRAFSLSAAFTHGWAASPSTRYLFDPRSQGLLGLSYTFSR